jgi:hypothetical protein
MPGLVTRGYGTGGPLVTRGLGFGPVPPGLLLPVSWFLVLQPGGVLGAQNTDLIAAIYNYWYSNPTLTSAFPGQDGSGARAFMIDESDFNTPLPRAVLTEVGSNSRYTPKGSNLEHPVLQFSIYAADWETARSLGYKVRNAYHLVPLSFVNGYYMAGVAGPLKTMVSGPGPLGVAQEYQTIIELSYTLARTG